MRSLLLVIAAVLVPAAALAAEGTYVSGTDRSRLLPPAGAVIEPYENSGYRLQFVEGAVEVVVDLEPLESLAPYQPPAVARSGRLGELADDLVRGQASRYAAVTSILGWIRTHVRYEMDRSKPQDPLAVFERGSAYCTGLARLSVALLRAAGIEAREVPGYVLEAVVGGPPAGFHRWVEVYYPDRGWVFSDPVATLNYVPASYVRLADEYLEDTPGLGRLIERHDATQEIDRATGTPGESRVRRNHAGREAAALVVRLEGASAGRAVLEGAAGRYATSIVDGSGRFFGVASGRYTLLVEVPGRVAAEKSIVFRAPVLAEVTIRVPTQAFGLAGSR